MRKRVFVALFLILVSSSCSSPCHQWKFAAIKADCPSATYVKVYLPECNAFNGLEAELVCNNCDMQFYLNAKTLLLPCSCNDQNHTELKIVVCENEYKFMAERLLGGQRLLLPEDARQLIICSLLEGNDVEVTVGRYQAMLISEGFAKTYDQLITEAFP